MSALYDGPNDPLYLLAAREALTSPAKHAERDSDAVQDRAPYLGRPDIMRALLNATAAEFGEATMIRRERREAEARAELARDHR